MTRRFPSLAIALVLTLTALVSMPAAAADSAPVPSSMAAVGDSITRAASTAGSLGADAPQNSWATGWSTSVHSHAERLGLPQSSVHNLSVSGAKVANLNDQMLNVAALTPDPGYLTVLIGGNDLCTDTVGAMTGVTEFRSQFDLAMDTITTESPGTYVYVVSIPDVYQLWDLFKGNFWARFIWSTADICQSLLANPTSNQTVDRERRALVQERNGQYNAALKQVCESDAYRARCRFDQNAVFNTDLVSSDVSGDYFHPSASGQAKLANVSWPAGYRFTTDPTPTPTPTPLPTPTPTPTPVATPTPTPTPTPTLTPTPTPISTPTPTPTPTPVAQADIRVADLDGFGTMVNRKNWRADVTATVTDTNDVAIQGATVTGRFGSGSLKSCTTGTSGTCTLTSDNLKTSVASVTFNLSGVTHATRSSTVNLETSVLVSRPPS